MFSCLRPDRWGLPAATLAAILLLSTSGSRQASVQPTGAHDALPLAVTTAAVVAWAPSTLLVSEVVTGAASASDEFVEIYNAGPSTADLGGLELVYVTSTGGTVTRKQTWSQLLLEPGRHLLLANSAGVWAGSADGLYSGGFSAAGGSLVLRSLAGTVIDSLSWGDASSGFVEGTAGVAPPAGSSLERLPGGSSGNATDTNDNSSDTFLQPAPVAHNLTAPPVPSSPPTPAPSASVAPPSPPDPSLAPDPTFVPDPTLLPDPTLPPVPTLAPDPTAPPTAEPTATLPPPAVTAAPTTTPQPSPSPALPSLAEVRTMPLGTSVSVAGQLTVPLGLVESGKGAFMQDDSGGISLYLAAGDWSPVPVGAHVVAFGTLETRFSQLNVRLEAATDLVATGTGEPPAPLARSTGSIGEDVEGRLVTVQGAIADSPSTLTDGFSTLVDDGSGGLRVVVAAATGIATTDLPRGSQFRLTGVVGQRDTSGTGLAGYRLHPRSPADVVALPAPDPSASPSPIPSASPTPSPTPAPDPSPTPSPTPAPTPAAAPIATARGLDIGVQVTVRGVVTVAPGRILGDSTLAIQDASGGICVRLPSESVPGLVPGRLVEVSGVLAAPFGNLELRPPNGGLSVVGTSPVPPPRAMSVADFGEATEGLLARVTATVRRIDASSTSLTLIAEDASGEGRIFIHRAVGLERSHFAVGQRIEATGIVGDRSGLYRLWPRDPSDVRLAGGPAGPTPAPGPTPSPSPDAGAQRSSIMSIASALRRVGQDVTVEGVVTVRPGLLDGDGRRVTIEDGTAAVLVRLAAGAAGAALGQRLRVSGEMGTYFGAPQLAADDDVATVGSGSVAPATIARAPLGASQEWRLVTVSGDVTSVHRDGDAWRAELAVAGGTIPILGLARSGIPAEALATGRRATVRGLVKRAHPTARDQRYGIVPRSAADIALGGATAAGAAPGSTSGAGGAVGRDPASGTATAGGAPIGNPAPGVPDASLSDLARHAGAVVRVGGRVAEVDGTTFVLHDGTAAAAVRLVGSAMRAASSIRLASLLNVTGEVRRIATGGVELVVDDPAAIHVAAMLRPVEPPPALAPVAPKMGLPPLADFGGAASGDSEAALAGLLIAVLAGLAAGAEAVRRWRRRADERRSAALIAARLPGPQLDAQLSVDLSSPHART